MNKKTTLTEKDTNLLDFQLKVKGIGKLTITFDARSRFEKIFLKLIDALGDKLEASANEALEK